MQGHRIGYVRVSSFDQNPERQLEQLQVSRVFTDKALGKDTQRGAYRGRKKALSDKQTADLRMRVAAGEPKAQLARELNISRQTLYQYLKTDD